MLDVSTKALETGYTNRSGKRGCPLPLLHLLAAWLSLHLAVSKVFVHDFNIQEISSLFRVALIGDDGGLAHGCEVRKKLVENGASTSIGRLRKMYLPIFPILLNEFIQWKITITVDK